MSETFYFAPQRIQQAVYDLFTASGSPAREAELVASRLVKSDLTGHPSHGLLRIPLYMRMIRRKIIVPGAEPEFSLDHGSTALLNGNRAYGQVAAEKTMTVAIERALAHGIAGVGVTNLGHIGRLADYAVSAARADCIGLVLTSAGGAASLVAPFGGGSARMATNPIALGVPSDRESPIVFDMATSVWAEGKFRALRAAGKPAPEHTLIDKKGRPSTNPDDLFDGGAILPLGGEQGYKGYLLNFMVEVLAGLLTGGGYAGMGPDTVFNNCTMMIVIDVKRFRPLPRFKMELENMIGYLKDSQTLEGKEVLYPGEVEARREEELRRTGIPLEARTVERLQEEMDHYGAGIRVLDLALHP